MIILKNAQHKSAFSTYKNVISSLIYFVLLLLPSLASAGAEIEFFDLEGGTKASALLAAIGLYGVITCHKNPDLANLYTGNVNGILKWVLRVALFTLLLPIIGNFAGFYFDKDVGATLIGTWGALKAAQGLYIGGVADGIRKSKK